MAGALLLTAEQATLLALLSRLVVRAHTGTRGGGRGPRQVKCQTGCVHLLSLLQKFQFAFVLSGTAARLITPFITRRQLLK